MSDTKKSAKGPALRKEHDSMGEILVPCDKYWGAQTQRSFENFRIGTEKMPPEVISAFAILKKSAAQANCELGTLPKEKAVLIEKACEEILDGSLDGNFPLAVWQTGSGIQSNMNTSTKSLPTGEMSLPKRHAFTPMTTSINPKAQMIPSRRPCTLPP